MRKQHWTVIMTVDETGQVLADHIWAASALSAMISAARRRLSGDGITVVCAVTGRRRVSCPGAAVLQGKSDTASAEDLFHAGMT